ncbi:cytochrome P450 [Serendipita vermifera]|nr:cytochrome P450 [Serendipita vermifera]
MVGTVAVTYAVAEVIKLFVKPLFSSHRQLRGPPSASLIFGHMLVEADIEVGGAKYHPQELWRREYGHIFKTVSFMGEIRCMLFDPKAIKHVLNDTQKYYHPKPLNYILKHILGEGLLAAQGPEHRHQRRLVLRSPPRAGATLKNILLEKTSSSDPDASRVDMQQIFSVTALDIIGLGGFNYSFNALREGDEATELSRAFHGTFRASSGLGALVIVKAYLSAFRVITFDHREREIQKARRSMYKIGMDLIKQKQEAVAMEHEGSKLGAKRDKDLLSLLIRSSMSTETPSDQRLTVEQILNQIPTFMIAGHETTATSLAWCLYSLSQNKAAQDRLRAELLEAFPLSEHTEDEDINITMEQMDALPYLDAVVKETLRFHPATENTFREAQEEDIVPVEKPYIDKYGKERHNIPVKKGDIFMIPIYAINRMEEIWGPDANEFKPERWLSPLPSRHSEFNMASETSNPVWGWGGVLTFSSGQRGCIGFRFAVLEMKAILLQVMRAFEFELAVPKSEIGKTHMLVSRPMVKSEPEKGNQLPMIVRPLFPKAT